MCEDVEYHNPNNVNDDLDNKDNGHVKLSLIIADAYQVERKWNVDTTYSHDLCKGEDMKELD